MLFNQKEVNERRISEISQEIWLYCAQKRDSMTPRAFDLARLSIERLLDNIADRNPKSLFTINNVRQGIAAQNDCVALCSEHQALVLARGIVYNYIGDDLNLYPITAEKKLIRTNLRKLNECDIPIEEMTVKDIIYITSAICEGEIVSKQTMRAVFKWFQDIGLDPIQARVFSVLFMKGKPTSLLSLPQQDLFGAEYKIAAKALVKKGFISELSNGKYNVTETVIA